MKRIIIVAIIAFIYSPLKSQEDRSKIIAETDVNALMEFSKAKTAEYLKQLELARSTATKRNTLKKNITGITKGGTILYGVDENIVAAAATRTNEVQAGGNLGLNLRGSGFTIGQWESGSPRRTHVVFSGRATQGDSTNTTSHATHVAGTLVSDGTGSSSAPFSRGMAPSATLQSYLRGNDTGEMAAAGAAGMLISNHSYGHNSGYAAISANGIGIDTFEWHGSLSNWNSGQQSELFGLYDQQSADWDELMHLAPYYLVVKSSGNERNDNPRIGDLVRHSSQTTWSTFSNNSPPADGLAKNGYDTGRTISSIKNGLVVGAIDNTDMNEQAVFSSWGPTDDGRIKPDLVGHGVGVFSANSNSDFSYITYSGTSMSTPNVAGSALLLQELHEDLFGVGQFMRSATLKALILHTTEDIDEAGPDYRNGYGLMNTEAAAELLQDAASDDGADLLEFTHTGSLKQYGFVSGCNENVHVTLAYTDLAGQAQSTLDNTTPNLVNDLDMVLINDNFFQESPFILDPANPALPATNGDNDLDNVEQIFSTQTSSVQILNLTSEGALTGGFQRYSLVSSGFQEKCVPILSQATGSLLDDVNFCALNALTTRATVPVGLEVKYAAGDRVKLLPGFHAEAGSKTKVYLAEKCN